MRNDLLFIDGELVDLDDSTKITLNYKSNLFTDLSKIVSNNSYTIKLPKTVRNNGLLSIRICRHVLRIIRESSIRQGISGMGLRLYRMERPCLCLDQILLK